MPGIKLTKAAGSFHPTTFECLILRITVGVSVAHLAAVYRPGSKPITSAFFEEFTQLLDFLGSSPLPFIVSGDLNIRMDRPADPHTVSFHEILDSHNATQWVSLPTHSQGGTLDVVITSSALSPTSSCSVEEVAFSDHSLVWWSTNIMPPLPPLYQTVQRRDWRNFDIDEFRTALASSNFISCESFSQISSVDQLVSQYNSNLSSLLDKFAPVRTLTLKKRTSSLWFDNDCRSSRKRVRWLERKYRMCMKRGLGCRNIHSAWKDSYRAYHKLCKQKQQQYWSTHIEENADPRKLWRVLDDAFCRQSTFTSHSDTDITASTLHDFFDSKVETVRVDTSSSPPPVYSPAPPGVKLTDFVPLAQSQVGTIIQSVANKYCSLDPAPTWLAKQCLHILLPFVTHLVNTSLSTGVFPTAYKTALVTPRLKKSGLDPTSPSSYRPISNLPFMSKVIERAVFQQMNTYLLQQDLYPPLQSAYRTGFSTETALLKVLSDLVDAVDSGLLSLVSFLDLSSAFDTVDHDTLLCRLQYSFGLTSAAFSWFQSYLSNRSQFVSFASSQTSPRQVLSGVPQGSVLGPLLFVLYTSDLIRLVQSHNLSVHLYADDTQIYTSCLPLYSDRSATLLQSCFADIASWMASNHLALNSAKTDLLWVHGPRRHLGSSCTQPLVLGGCSVSPSSSVRNLGVDFDSTLSFSPYISRLISSCFYQLRCIRSCIRSLPRSAAVTAVNSFVVSRLDYCNSLFTGLPDSQLTRLQRVLNAAARLLSRTSKFSSITPYLRDTLHWLPIKQRIEFKLAVLTYKALNGLAPSYLADSLQCAYSASTVYNLRSTGSYDLIVPRSRLVFGDRSFRCAAPRVWNSLPDFIRSCQSLPAFKKDLKAFLFYKAYYS